MSRDSFAASQFYYSYDFHGLLLGPKCFILFALWTVKCVA